MAFGAFEKHVLGPRREAIKRARLAKEQAAEAAEERASDRDAAVAWNQRRLQTKERGEQFNEPFPSDEEIEGHIEGVGDQKMSDETTQQPAPKVWRHSVGQAEFILQAMSESLVRVTHRDQVGYIGINRDWDIGRPYTWKHMDRTVGVSRAVMERYTSADGIHGNLFGEATPEQALNVLCDIQLHIQMKEDSQRDNSEERKVLREFLDELPDWAGG